MPFQTKKWKTNSLNLPVISVYIETSFMVCLYIYDQVDISKYLDDLCSIRINFYYSSLSLVGLKGKTDYITETCLYDFDPLKPHFYIVKLGFTGVYIIFLIPAQNIDCGYPLEPPRRGGSNEYPQSMFWAEIWKKKKKNQIFDLKACCFLVVKFSIYLNRRVFVTVRREMVKY